MCREQLPSSIGSTRTVRLPRGKRTGSKHSRAKDPELSIVETIFMRNKVCSGLAGWIARGAYGAAFLLRREQKAGIK